MEEKKRKVSGTREWAVAAVDCAVGCSHGCLYCYGRHDAVKRRQLVSGEQWNTCRVLPETLTRDYPLYPGTVMFPTNHDIVPEIIDACTEVIRKLLLAGNRVLVVTKPHLVCVQRLCREFDREKDRFLFRFTITARGEDVLRFWEPGAPLYAERRECLKYACERGFSTSVSVEPILDMDDVVAMVEELLPYVTQTVWLGKMNRIRSRVEVRTAEDEKHVARIVAKQGDEEIMALYRRLCREPRIRWKESIKEVVGLAPAERPGMDL